MDRRLKHQFKQPYRPSVKISNPHVDEIPRSYFVPSPVKQTESMNIKDTASRAIASGVSGGLGSLMMYGDGGYRPLPLIGTPVPSAVAVGGSCALGSVASDVVQNFAESMAMAQTPVARTVVGLGAAGLTSGYLMQGETPGSFWENAALGAAAYTAGDYVTSKVYQSPGRLF